MKKVIHYAGVDVHRDLRRLGSCGMQSYKLWDLRPKQQVMTEAQPP